MYLKTPNAPGQRTFSRCAAPFFTLKYVSIPAKKMSCSAQKFLAAGHIGSFQIHPRYTHELDISNLLRLTEKTQGCFWDGPELGERMSRKATEFQKKEMSRMYRGKENFFKPPNTGWIDENVACVREWVANIFFLSEGRCSHHDRRRVSLRPAGRTISNSPSPTRTSSAPPFKKTRPRPRRPLRRLRRVRRHAGAGESRPAEGRGPVKHRGQLVINTTSVGADDSGGSKMLQI